MVKDEIEMNQLQIGKDIRVGLQIPPSLNRHFRAAEENLRLGGTGADQKYDYKSQGLSPNATPSEAANHQYRGSQIAPGVYASARDVGNIFAGMYGSLFGTAKHPVLKAMGAFNANQNKLNGALAGQLFQNWRAPYGEDYRSHYMQNVGFDMGKNNALFRKKFGVN